MEIKKIYDVLNANNTISVNRYLAHEIGLNAAVVYSALIAKSKYYTENGWSSDGWFYSTEDDLRESTSLSPYQQRSAVKTLVKCGLIACERRGLPAKRCFYIVDNMDGLKKLLKAGEKTANKYNPTSSTVSDDVPKKGRKTKPTPRLKKRSQNDSETCLQQVVEKAENKFDSRDNDCNEVSPRHSYYNQKKNKHKEINQSIGGDKIDRIERKNKISSEQSKAYEQLIKDNINYPYLQSLYKSDSNIVEEITDIMTDVVTSNSKYTRVCSENKPTEVVRSAFLKLTEDHIQYVIDSLHKNTTKVRNIKNYIITALYNAKLTLNSYYQSEVNHDMYGVPCAGV